MKRTALALGAVFIAAAALSAQTQQAPPSAAAPAAPAKADAAAPTIAGKWTITMDFGQGPTDIYADMKLDGKKLTGTLSSQMGDTALAGEFAEGKANWSINFDGGGGAMTLTFTATMKDADHLNGNMAGPMGDVPWTAVRAKG